MLQVQSRNERPAPIFDVKHTLAKDQLADQGVSDLYDDFHLLLLCWKVEMMLDHPHDLGLDHGYHDLFRLDHDYMRPH